MYTNQLGKFQEFPARTSAVAAMADDGTNSGLAVLSGRRIEDPRARRARVFAKRVAFVRQTYRFLAFQAARPPLILERSVNGGSEWVQVPIEDDPLGYEILSYIRPPNGGNQADLVRRAVWLDGTIGEFMIVDVTHVQGIGDGVTPAFIVRDPSTCQPKRGIYTVTAAPNAKRSDGPRAWFQVPSTKVKRVWQEEEEWDLMATSSLMGLVDDLDTLWDLCRQLKRQSRSRLTMNDILWSPSEAHVEQIEVNGEKKSKFDVTYARMAEKSLNDLDDSIIASVAPFSMNTPGRGPNGQIMPTPKIIVVPGLDQQLLTYIQDQRLVVAASLPLSSSAIFDAIESKNHWGDWLADEQDVQVVEESLRRVLDGFTVGILRPSLDWASDNGRWRGGDSSMWRIGVNTDLLRRDIDNSENVRWASDRGLINDIATRKGLHLKESDAMDDVEFGEWAARRRIVAEVTRPAADQRGIGPGGSTGPLALPAAPAALPAGGPVPNGGQVPAAQTASAHVVNDLWMLGLPRPGG